jgi:hypothetical protein
MALALVALNLCRAPQTAHANILEKLFPHVFGNVAEKEAEPAKTLVAPFANEGTKVAPEAMKNPMEQLTDKNVPVDQANRSDKDVGSIISDTVAGLLMFDFSSYEATKKKYATMIAPSAIAQHDAFMRSSGILRALEPGVLRLNNFVETRPVMLGKGVYGGTYRWLFEVPMTLTLLDKSAKGFNESRAESHSVLVKVQVARINDERNNDGFIIETMEFKQRSRQ